MKDKIDIQREKIAQGNPTIDLADSCRIDNGIKALNEKAIIELAQAFDANKDSLDICFFVPASGSGSRMFSGLYNFLNEPNNSDFRNEAKSFVQSLPQLALFSELPSAIKEMIEDEDQLLYIVQFILTEEGLNLGNQPKGLIPFHLYEEYSTTPFQEHLLQGKKIGNQNTEYHFTINKAFEGYIDETVNIQRKRDQTAYKVSFSEQDPSTNSVAFDHDLNVVMDDNGNPIERPAGHGTLIHNLNKIDADIIFIRNIDNMQHLSKAETSINSRKALANVLLEFRDDVFNILKKLERGDAFSSSVGAFNDKYDMRIPKELYGKEEFAKRYFGRPLRVCGMVKNEGAPGGGPFWVNERGNQVRQIIEKSQISENEEQIALMESATHFNPVELVCSVKNRHGKKYDLSRFVNEEQYFIVNKTQEGREIQYIEQPGLWNGAMAHWLTLFYEIDVECFSPVKTVMNLLKPAHQA